MREEEQSCLELDPKERSGLADLIGHSVTYRIAVGARAERKVLTLQSAPPREEDEGRGAATADGFSLHAGVGVGAAQRPRLEHLCRYLTRPAVASGRLALTGSGPVRDGLKTPYRDATTHVVLEPLDFMARLAAWVPPPRAHRTLYHGVFAPRSRWRGHVVPNKRAAAAEGKPVRRPGAMSWMQRLKRVVAIDIATCRGCGGR